MRNRRKIDKNTRTNVLKYQIRDFIVISKNFRYQKIKPLNSLRKQGCEPYTFV